MFGRVKKCHHVWLDQNDLGHKMARGKIRDVDQAKCDDTFWPMPNNWLMNTLHQNTFYILGTLCIVKFCSKEQFTSNWLITVYSSVHFASWNVWLLGTLCSPTPFAPSELFAARKPFASQHTLLPGTLCSSAPLPPWNTLLLNTFSSLELFAPKHIMLLGIHLTMRWNM